MSHHLEIDTYGDELHLRLICTATPGSDCRKRPADPEQESWASDDPTLTDGHECWAVEWVESGGWECIKSARDTEWPTIPVTVEYDEGVIVAPIVPQETLPDHAAAIAETVSETVPARHETPDVAELRRLLDATQRRLSSPRRAGKTYEMDRLRDAAVRALPALLGAATELTHMTEARDNARAEVERLAALLAEVRETAEHYYGQAYADGSAAVLRILIKPYPCGPEPDHHDHMASTGDVTGYGRVARVDCPESECPTCTEEIIATSTTEGDPA